MTTQNADVLSLTADAVFTWVAEHLDLLEGLAALRALGAQATDAIEAVLAIREIRVLRASFELFEHLAEHGGADARALLREVGSDAQVSAFEAAVFGRSASSPRR